MQRKRNCEHWSYYIDGLLRQSQKRPCGKRMPGGIKGKAKEACKKHLPTQPYAHCH
jgi:hypothetical protein